jgi:hypothetical protein
MTTLKMICSLNGISSPRDQFSHVNRHCSHQGSVFPQREILTTWTGTVHNTGSVSQTRDILTMWTGTYKYLHCSHQVHNLSYHVNRYLQAHIQYCASTTCETDYWCNFESCTKPDTYVYIEGYFNWNHKGATICGRGVIYTDAPVCMSEPVEMMFETIR